MKMYKTGGFEFYIEEVDVIRKTDVSVWLKDTQLYSNKTERRESMNNTLYQYWTTQAEAKQYLIAKWEKQAKSLEERLRIKRKDIHKLNELY